MDQGSIEMALGAVRAGERRTYGSDSAGSRDCAHGPAGLAEGVPEHDFGGRWNKVKGRKGRDQLREQLTQQRRWER